VTRLVYPSWHIEIFNQLTSLHYLESKKLTGRQQIKIRTTIKIMASDFTSKAAVWKVIDKKEINCC